MVRVSHRIMPGPIHLSQPAMIARTLAHESGGSHLQWGHFYSHFDEEHGRTKKHVKAGELRT